MFFCASPAATWLFRLADPLKWQHFGAFEAIVIFKDSFA